MMNKKKLFENEIQSSIYLGWRGFGSWLGRRFYLNIENKVIKIISNSPFKGIEMQEFLASDVLQVELQKPSFFYAISGALVVFLKQIFEILIKNEEPGLNGLIVEVLIAFFFSVIVGVVIERLYERPRIEFLLEGGTKNEVFTSFNSNIPEIIQTIEVARRGGTSKNMRSSHSFYAFQIRSLPNKTKFKLKRVAFLPVVIVAVTIGILVSISIPAYQDYTSRAQIAGGIASVSELKTTVVEYVLTKGKLPNSNTELGIQEVINSEYVQSIIITEGGRITVTMNDKTGLLGKTFYFIPSVAPDRLVQWACRSDSIESKYLPLSCRNK